MMGRKSRQIGILMIDVEETAPSGHLLRKTGTMISFDFIYRFRHHTIHQLDGHRRNSAEHCVSLVLRHLERQMLAGIFDECGRYVVIKILMKKNKTRGNGIGHGGIKVWAVTLMSIVGLRLSLWCSGGRARKARCPSWVLREIFPKTRWPSVGGHRVRGKLQRRKRCAGCAERAGAMPAVEVWLGFWAALPVIWAKRLYREM